MIHILYHANCCDGFAAACIARKALLHGREASPGILQLHPVTYETPMPITRENFDAQNDRLVFVDFTPPEKWLLEEMSDLIHPKNCIVIDHHKTNADVHANFARVFFTSVFDPTKSGTVLTWEHFYSAAMHRYRCLDLLQHYDLGGVWEDPKHAHTNEARWLVAYLMRALPRTPDAWTPVLLDYDTHRNHALDLGARIIAADMRLIRATVRTPHWVVIGGYEVPAVNGIPFGMLNDALAEMLIEHTDAPFAACWTVLGDADAGGVIKWSLRSRKNGFDCATLCKSLSPNGGGHHSAAGFATTEPVHFV